MKIKNLAACERWKQCAKRGGNAPVAVLAAEQVQQLAPARRHGRRGRRRHEVRRGPGEGRVHVCGSPAGEAPRAPRSGAGQTRLANAEQAEAWRWEALTFA